MLLFFRHKLGPMCSASLILFGCSFVKLPLVIGGLVGLREAQRISSYDDSQGGKGKEKGKGSVAIFSFEVTFPGD